MAINFDALPVDKPAGMVIPKGTYFAKIVGAEMKQPKDETKPQYLNMRLSLKDSSGKDVGTLFDKLVESEKPLMQYKLSRFLKATELSFEGSFELRDLQKIILNKEFIVSTTVKQQEGQPDQAEVNLFDGEIYYPLSAASTIFGDDSISSINAQDALDHEDF